ncbi:ABC transporter permease [Haloglycomyces albus]|uniref:ABC transporter permease n=1 Tax=Haloglycomyces albus TaxID=526067 RepID=UPI00046CF1DB|nr:ABC transporter permease [Haloglycomyces albus]
MIRSHRKFEKRSRFIGTCTGIALEASQSIRGRAIRTWLTALGIALGIAATVATVGLSSTAANAISDRFNEVEARSITVSYSETLRDQGHAPTIESTQRVRDINGVEQAGIYCESTSEVPVSRTNEANSRFNHKIYSSEPETLIAFGVEILEGGYFDRGHLNRNDNIALIDSMIADELGYSSLEGAPVIYVDGIEYAIGGVFESTGQSSKFDGTVVVPPTHCLRASEEFNPASIYVRTDLGAADKVLESVAVAAFPEAPGKLDIASPIGLDKLRSGVTGEMKWLVIAMAIVSLVIGAVSVSNTSLVAVMERRGEIGLRRAVGASRIAVAAQFLFEAAITGILGGITGTILGINAVAGVALLRDWQLVFNPALLAAGPGLGAAVGIVAGMYPAWRASKIAPAVALRT